MQGGTAATQDVFIENVGIPTLAAIRPAVQALQDLGMHRKVQLIVSGGIRNGADVAKVSCAWRRCRRDRDRGADRNRRQRSALREQNTGRSAPTAGAYDDWHEGRDPAGITTQDPELARRLDPVMAGRRLANFLAVLTLEAKPSRGLAASRTFTISSRKISSR